MLLGNTGISFKPFLWAELANGEVFYVIWNAMSWFELWAGGIWKLQRLAQISGYHWEHRICQLKEKPGHFPSIRTLQLHGGNGNSDALPNRAEEIPFCSYHTLWMQERKPHKMATVWVFWPSQPAHISFSIGCKSGVEVVSSAQEMWAEIGSCQLIVSSCIISFQFVCPPRDCIVGESNRSEDKTMAVGSYRTCSPLPYL